jgi:transcriptional regulator with XRE-family HTH domain
MTKGKADDIDEYVGQQIRSARIRAGLSMEQLGEKIGVSYQQISKYETAKNRAAPGRLFLIAKATGQSIFYFFPGCENE